MTDSTAPPSAIERHTADLPSASARARWRLMVSLLRTRACTATRAAGPRFIGCDRSLDLERRQSAAFAADAAQRQVELHAAIDVLLARHTRRRP